MSPTINKATLITDRPTRAIDLERGDVLDLAGDKYADPDDNDASYQYEYAIVDSIMLETSDCVLVNCTDTVFACPPVHEVIRMVGLS